VNWSPIGISTTGSVSTITDIKADNYTANITDANGCTLVYNISVIAAQGDLCGITVPEIFSPNGDTKNDVWEIKGLANYPNNTVQVFNRWGDEVYNQAPYKNDWNGTNYGAKSVLGKGELPSGTYYFILDLGDGSKPMTGYVQLVR
jgi:gliding motility-associated-like protein